MSSGTFSRCADCSDYMMLYPEFRDGDDWLCRSCYEAREEEYNRNTQSPQCVDCGSTENVKGSIYGWMCKGCFKKTAASRLQGDA